MCVGGGGFLARGERHRAGGQSGRSYLLHHLTSGEFVVAGDDCRNRKREIVNYLILLKCSWKDEVIIVTHQLPLFDNGSGFLSRVSVCLLSWLKIHRTPGQS